MTDLSDEELLDLLTAVEVARLLRCSVRWVYDLANQDELPSVQIGRRILFARKEVAAFARSKRCAPKPPPPKRASTSPIQAIEPYKW